MELRTVLALLKKYWLIPVLGMVIGALGGFALVYVNDLVNASGSSFTATVRAQVTGVQLSPQLSGDIDYRIKGAIALGLSDAEVAQIIKDAGIDPGADGTADDGDAFWAAVAVTKLDGPAIQVAATFDDAAVAERVAERVLTAYEPRLLASFASSDGVNAGEPVRIVRENGVVSTGLRSRLALGAIAGLLVGLAVVAVIYARRRPVVTEQEVEAIADLPVVANLHGIGRNGNRHDAVLTDRLGVLATKLALASESPVRVVVWGSPSPAERQDADALATAFTKVSGEGTRLLDLPGRTGSTSAQVEATAAGATAQPLVPGGMSTAAVRQSIEGALVEAKQVVSVADLQSPAGLATLTAADAGLVVVALGRTSVTAFTDAIVDLKQAGATPAGIVLT